MDLYNPDPPEEGGEDQPQEDIFQDIEQGVVEDDKVAQLEKMLAEQQKREVELLRRYEEKLERLRGSKYQLPEATTSHSTGSFIRVVIPDTHGAFVDEAAIGAFLGDLPHLDAKEVIWLGDHLECGSFLAQHHTVGYVAEVPYTFEDDCNAANQLLDQVQTLTPNARHHYLEGNHERRIERWCVTTALKSGTENPQEMADHLMNLYGAEHVLSLEKRGIPIYKQGKFYMGLPIPATIKLGACHFTHGSRTGVHAAKSTLDDFGGNVVFGHTHRADTYTKRTINEGVIGSWNPGCLCLLQRFWNHDRITGWSHGYGVQIVDDRGHFLHINVPVREGKSYLSPLLEILK